MMKILVDADACPVKEIIEKVAKQKNIEVDYVYRFKSYFKLGLQ